MTILCDVCERSIRLKTTTQEGEKHYHIYAGTENENADFIPAKMVTICGQCMPSEIKKVLEES